MGRASIRSAAFLLARESVVPLVLIAIALLLTACGPRDPGTASEVEAEALNKAAADLDAQAPPADTSSEK